MATVRMYTTHLCPYCNMAERLLNKKGARIEKIFVDELPEQRREMVKITGMTSVPQIFIGTTYVGGYRELAILEQDGQLDPLLAGD